MCINKSSGVQYQVLSRSYSIKIVQLQDFLDESNIFCHSNYQLRLDCFYVFNAVLPIGKANYLCRKSTAYIFCQNFVLCMIMVLSVQYSSAN
jgi:hypothetical protein